MPLQHLYQSFTLSQRWIVQLQHISAVWTFEQSLLSRWADQPFDWLHSRVIKLWQIALYRNKIHGSQHEWLSYTLVRSWKGKFKAFSLRKTLTLLHLSITLAKKGWKTNSTRILVLKLHKTLRKRTIWLLILSYPLAPGSMSAGT